jgi:hypothetical protein
MLKVRFQRRRSTHAEGVGFQDTAVRILNERTVLSVFLYWFRKVALGLSELKLDGHSKWLCFNRIVPGMLPHVAGP